MLTIIENLAAVSIAEASMGSAVTLADWYLNEALRLQGTRVDARLQRAQQLLDWLLARSASEGSDGIPYRDILRFGPNAVRTKARADEAVAVLVEHEWVEDTRQRPRMVRLLGEAS